MDQGHRELIAERRGFGSRGGWLISLWVIGAVALAMVLTSYPLAPMTVSGEVSARGTENCVYCGDQPLEEPSELPMGETVSVSWSEDSGYTVSFLIVDSTDSVVCSWYAPHGACSFVSSGGNYSVQIIPPNPPTEPSYRASYTFEWFVPPI